MDQLDKRALQSQNAITTYVYVYILLKIIMPQKFTIIWGQHSTFAARTEQS